MTKDAEALAADRRDAEDAQADATADRLRQLLDRLSIEVQAATYGATVGRLVGQMLRPGGRVMIEQAENGGEFLAMFRTPGGRSSPVATGESLADAVEALHTQTLTRCCTRCLRHLPLSDFSHLESGKARRNRACKQCEARRVARHEAQRRADRAKAGEKEPMHTEGATACTPSTTPTPTNAPGAADTSPSASG